MARGELRIYIGAAPGVGKTYAMLNEGRRRRDRGTDVVVGFVETHGRGVTAAAIADLEVVPRRQMSYRGEAFEELDADRVLARSPQVALVDDLAHTNVPGSRNEKRWQDIEQLLAAGITVISTVNVQHLESLNDVIERITGIVLRETVPDAVVRAADQIELVDITPEALRRRMAHGNIYEAEEVDAALAHYFRVGNLSALRELALLWVADRVDEGLEEYRERQGITEPWETRERVVVALTGAPGGEQLIRRGARMVARSHADLVGVHVRTADGLTAASQDLLDRHRLLLEELGGRYAEVTGADTADALVDFATAENATQLVLGASGRSRWAEPTRGSVINRAIRKSGPLDVHVISTDLTTGTRHPPRGADRRARVPRSSRARTIAWLVAFIAIPLIVLGLLPFRDAIGVPGMLLVLLLAPVGVALLGGLAPALAASAVAFILADWFFIEPTHSIRFARRRRAGPGRVRRGLRAGEHPRRSVGSPQRAAGQEPGRDRDAGRAGVGHRLARHRGAPPPRDELHLALGLEAVAVLVPTVDGWKVEACSGQPVPATPEGASYCAELASGAMLVVSGPSMAADDRRLLSAFVAQRLRVAQETLRLQAEALTVSSLAEGNRIREALLAAVSHDLRGPLANIKAAATSMLSEEVDWPKDEVRSFCKTIDAEADRLHSVITNLLDMGRVQAGMLGVQLAPVPVDEAVYAALASLSTGVSLVDVELPGSLPPVLADPALFERALANVVQNAVNWAPEGTRVRVEAGVADERVHVRVVDRGTGIPRDQRVVVFQPFQRLGDGGHATYDGIGLGLAVTRSFVEVMGGEIAVEDTPGGGATIVIMEVAA